MMLLDLIRISGALALAALVAPLSTQDVAATADAPVVLFESGPTAVLRFEIQDESGAPMPGRLTLVPPDGGNPELFQLTGALPDDLAVRKNVVYSLSGKGAITVPTGIWQVVASRGPEWSLGRQTFNFEADGEYVFQAPLIHEVDTDGWVSGDFHLHTLTHSGHGDANMKERIISIIGEGLEFAVATDHNHNTDYRPTIDGLGASEHMTSMVGNEVSVPIGHFNAFPLDPDRPVPDPKATDANALFAILRAETNEHGVRPIIQVNHPRWREIDYFTLAGLDPVTGEPTTTDFSWDFDTIEVLNENAGWGYYDADVMTDVATGTGIHSALGDWYNMLNHGRRVFAVGNSDSHTVHHSFAGYPRNYVDVGTDDPGSIDPVAMVEAIRTGRMFTTTGPFLDFRINGQPSGSTISTTDEVRIETRIQTPSWMDVSRIKVIVSGWQLHEQAPALVEDPPPSLPWNGGRLRYKPTEDCWLVVIIEGDTPLDPVVTGADRPVMPLAISNPIWIDHDGDGVWTSPWDQAVELVRDNPSMRMLRLHGVLRKTHVQVANLMLAMAQAGRADTKVLIKQSLPRTVRILRLAAARAAERTGEPELVAPLESAMRLAEDPYLMIALGRAVLACGGELDAGFVPGLFEKFGAERVRRYAHELGALLSGTPVSHWEIVGYFGEPGAEGLLEQPFGPEGETEEGETHLGRDGTEVAWQPATVDEDGYLDLRSIDPERSENCVAYARTHLFAPEALEVRCALGTDDGARVFLNGEVVHTDTAHHGASPLQHIVNLSLKEGWNEVLFKVENGSGDFGLYFRPLEGGLRASAQPN